MTPPTNAVTNADGRRYYQWAGETYWSVTTLLNAVPKPKLVGWAARETAKAAVENTKTGLLAQMVKADADGAADFLTAARFKTNNQATSRGTSVHDYIEARVLGTEPKTLADDERQRADQFERWVTEYRPGFEMAEATVYNREQAYAGTLDMLVDLPGYGLGVVDVKTGKAAYPEVALQLNAYAGAEFIGLPDGREHPMPEIKWAAVLLLRPRSYQFTQVELSDRVFRAFLIAREMYRWLHETSGEVLLGPIPVPATDQQIREHFGEAA